MLADPMDVWVNRAIDEWDALYRLDEACTADLAPIASLSFTTWNETIIIVAHICLEAEFPESSSGSKSSNSFPALPRLTWRKQGWPRSGRMKTGDELLLD
ncbi:hypothetical protein MVLG_04372 [Microbotryum lychnidis-dioicae p1A1 Lamole]|uniref:Uncharacterized protein n=1 Tax=Microbotryum lychnidis-dioicae (strain p1A1 Lamole / MvSl-1064) TaxID=683840 RepID=U5HB10_USTV1|nr:hypothetical protein MVLG_04372 [Microbotryum lychnidis-dioicae p1A1 Lamole]|eukprot:KDE05237.1 hypothetical protein MVLG_04372 [Microbotryum lychnidis-dioicae p1A1 Lamole]